MDTEKMFSRALSSMESFDAYMISLSSGQGEREEEEEEGEGVGRDEIVKALTEAWLDLKRNLKSVFSQKGDEIRHLQYALEKASASDHSEGLRSELREDVAKHSPEDGEVADPMLVEPGVLPELGERGIGLRLPDRNVVGAELGQEEAPLSEKHEIASHISEAGMESEQDTGPHSGEQDVVTHTSVTGMEQEQEVALHSEKQEITVHTPETRMPSETEVLPHLKEQGTAGMEPEIDSVSSQHGIETETASTENLAAIQAGKTLSNSGTATSNSQIPDQESQNEGMEMQEPTPADGTSASEESSEYQKVEYAVLFYHKSTGYYYDPATQLFYTPVTSDQQYAQSNDQQGEGQTTSTGATWGDYASGMTSDGQTGHAGQTGSVAEMLAAASDRVTERCGYSYNDSVGMYYDNRLGLYYDQESKLYYDPDQGTYYYFDPETRQYAVHSRVKLPAKTEPDQEKIESESKEEVIDLCSSEEEFADSPEEGEIRTRKRPRLHPRLPHGSPPPEDEWDPCIRMVVSSSESLPEGTLFMVTQDGASVGREPSGPHGIKVPEVQVSKTHASLAYNKRKQCFTIKDEGSANGTFLNEKRLSEARESSKSRRLSHGHTLTLGTTTLTIHIHTGWETCEECDPALLGGEGGRGGGGGGGAGESLDVLRRRELNRIKKRYGLRAKDTYGDKEVQLAESYKDRASTRRKKVGSEPLEFCRPDDPPASVHRPLSGKNRGHKMLVKMGWQEGQGLGKDNTGVAEPIQTKVRTEKVGLGSNFSTRSLEAAATHSATQRHHRMMRHFSDVISREEAQKSKLKEKKGKSGSVDIFVE